MAFTSDSSSAFRTDEVRLREVWAELKAGRLKVLAVESSDSEHLLTLSHSGLNEGQPPAEELRAFEQAVLVGYQRVALDLAVPVSTVVTAARAAAEWLGVPRSAGRMTPLLAFAVLAAHRGSDAMVRREWRGHVRLSMPRPEGALGAELDVHERAIVRLLVEGNDYRGVAEKYRLGKRLAANKISQIFKKLNVASRRELMALAFALIDARERTPAGG